jgi:TolB-like protein
MKTLILSTLLSSALFCASTQKADGFYLDIYADKDPQSNIIATISDSKGKLTTQRCFTIADKSQWCKVEYVNDSITLNGYTDKKSLDILRTTPNLNNRFKMHYGGQRNEIGTAIVALKDGFLIAGKTDSFGAGQSDAYVMRTDAYGNKVYSNAYGGASDETINAVVKLDNGFMLAGTTRSLGNGVDSIYMLRITKSGKKVWEKAYYSDKDDYYVAKDMVKISKNNVLVAGYEDHVQFFNSEVNIYLNAISTDGVRNGIKRYGGTKVDFANSIISTDDGYVMAGMTKSWGHGGEDAYVIKIDKEGNRVWHNAFGFRYDEQAEQIIQTKDGAYILVGTTDSDHKSQDDIYVVKINANGTRAWHRHYGSNEHEAGMAIVQSDDGGYLVVGSTNDTPSYNSDIYLLKIDKNGLIEWDRKYGDSKDDKALAVIKTEDGYAITGYVTHPQSYSKDMLLLKVDKNGNLH